MYKKILLSIILMTAFAITPVFAAKNYNSAKSNTSSIAQVNEHIGNILLRYNFGGAEINKVTNALAIGITDVDLKVLLTRIGLDGEVVRIVFTELDRLGVGINEEGLQSISTLETKSILRKDATMSVDTLPSALPDGRAYRDPLPTAESTISGELHRPPALNKIKQTEDTARGDVVDSAYKKRVRYGNITLKRAVFHDVSKNIIQNIRSATPEDRENLLDELKTNRETFQSEIVSMSLKIHENAQDLRENFRENVISVIGHVDHGKTARIAVAHGRSLKMLNRFRSAIARFDHILLRIESRALKLEARGIDISSLIPSIEEAKNISLENKTHMEQLKATYELLLLGENPRGIAEDARTIAEDLKTKINKLHIRISTITTEMVSLDLRGVGVNEEDFN